MTKKILDDLDLYSDLLLSIGTHAPNRPFTPIEVSDILLRLKEETGESWEELSKRVGLGKKKKNSMMKKGIDTTQIRLFEKLQHLSRRNAYAIGWGQSKDGRISMTSGCNIAKLPNKDDHDILINTIIESSETEKPILKEDVRNILDRKTKSSETPIDEIIEYVMKVKPVTELIWNIGISPEKDFIEKFKTICTQEEIQSTELLQRLMHNRFQNIIIKSIILSKNNIIWITLDKENFKNLENEWISKKIPITTFFNKVLREEIDLG